MSARVSIACCLGLCGILATACGPKREDHAPTACVASSDGADACVVEGGSVSIAGVTTSVESFALDRDEVTVARFRAFVESYTGPPAAGAGQIPSSTAPTGWNAAWNAQAPPDAAGLIASLKGNGHCTWTDDASSSEELPINCVSWYAAVAFCASDGGFLPSEVEWLYAAQGGSDGRRFPWGDAAPSAERALYACSAQAKSGPCGSLTSVGSRPLGVGKWGQLDLAGSVAEWVFDSYPEPSVDPFPVQTPCDDCVDTAMVANHVTRGGAWTSEVAALANSDREWWAAAPPAGNTEYNGFRCARLP